MNCLICFEEELVEESIKLKCNHEYCISCIKNWVRVCSSENRDAQCPTCRRYIENSDLNILGYERFIIITITGFNEEEIDEIINNIFFQE